VDNASCSENTYFQNYPEVFYISGVQLHKDMRDFMFRRGVNEIFAFMAYYAA
jgi:hypothetical protein